MEARVLYGWTFGKRKRVMAIDLIMAEAALLAARSKGAGNAAGGESA